jgi:hypothetical protein
MLAIQPIDPLLAPVSKWQTSFSVERQGFSGFLNRVL